MQKQKLVKKEEFIGNVKEVKDGKVHLEDGKSVKFDAEVHELQTADKDIPAWKRPDYDLIPELDRVVELSDGDKPLKVLSAETSADVAAEFADSHTAYEASANNLAVPEPHGKVDIKAREAAKDEESRKQAAEAEADKSKKSNK